MIGKEYIEQYLKGNFDDFRELVEKTSPFVFSVAFRILGDEDEAKDIVQETMITVWKKIEKIKSAACFRTWLYRIVMNKCYDQLRKRKSHPEVTADDQTWAFISNHISVSPSYDLENSEIALIINLLTNKLSPCQRILFILSDIEGMSHEEISAVTGLNRMNIKANLHYARKKIAGMIEKYI